MRAPVELVQIARPAGSRASSTSHAFHILGTLIQIPERRVKLLPGVLIAALACVGGCSDDDDDDAPAADGSGTAFALDLADGTAVRAESLECIYRQSFGAVSELSLQLQYLAGPGEVAFALYVDDPVPAAPYAAAAGQQGRFTFEAFAADGAYRDELADGEIDLGLDSLPAPSELSDGDVVPLRGGLTVVPFSLSQAAAGDGGQGAGLALAGSTIDVDCDAVYQLAETVDGG